MLHLPSSMPILAQMDLARGGFAVPLKIFTVLFDWTKNRRLSAEEKAK
jgi:hypothetical protein